MTSEKFCLRWNDFEKNISGAFRELRDDKDFFDVTLACDDEQMYAHKVILSACSSFFRNILRRNPHQHPLLYLKGVKYTDLQSVLNFMYHGEVNVAQEELNSFLAVAEDLQVKGLTQNNSGSFSKKSENKPTQQQNPNAWKSLPKSTPSEAVSTIRRQQPASVSASQAAINRYLHHTGDDDTKLVIPVKSEPKDPPSSYQAVPIAQTLCSTQPSNPTNHQLTSADHQALDYQDESYEDYGEYDGDHDQGFEGTVAGGQEGNGTKVFITHDKVSSYIQEQCLYQTDNSGSKFWCCGVCQKYLNHKRDLMRHIESFHVDTTPYVCTHCEAQFNTRRSVQRHTLAVHNTTYAQ